MVFSLDADAYTTGGRTVITQREYDTLPEKHWIGKKVRTLRTMQSREIVIPAGTVMVIQGKFAGFELEGLETCPHCKIGRRIYMTRVSPEGLELIEEGAR
jgi:hypothetical protein